MEALKVAIADDNELMLDMLGELISSDKDLNIVGKAKNGEEICQIIKEQKPDVVLLDLIMPKMDGLELVREVQNFPTSRRSLQSADTMTSHMRWNCSDTE